mgnify:CR=1 FL=1
MFKFFIVTFEILALVMVLRTSFVQFWLSDIQSSTADWMLEMSMLRIVTLKEWPSSAMRRGCSFTLLSPRMTRVNYVVRHVLLQWQNHNNLIFFFNSLDFTNHQTISSGSLSVNICKASGTYSKAISLVYVCIHKINQ